MTSAPNLPAAQPARKARGVFTKFARNTHGTTAIEFAMVGLPFLLMLFGTLIIGLFFFTTFALENAVERAGRLIRTGQVAAANMSEADFKAEVCSRVPVFVDCNNKLIVLVQSFADNAASIGPLGCLNPAGTDLTNSSSFDPGTPNAIVLVTVCYKWELTAAMPFFDLGNMGASRNRLIQASTTFRTEPYEGG